MSHFWTVGVASSRRTSSFVETKERVAPSAGTWVLEASPSRSSRVIDWLDELSGE